MHTEHTDVALNQIRNYFSVAAAWQRLLPAGCLQSWKEQKKPKKQSYCGIMLKSSNGIFRTVVVFHSIRNVNCTYTA